MRRALIGAITAALLAAAWASRAQPPATAAPAPTGNTVEDLTVVGRKSAKPPPSFSSAVSAYVRSNAQPSSVGNLSRWRVPLCPYTAGLTPALNAFVSQRIVEIAARVGAPSVGRCATNNVLVVFTTEPQKVVDDVRRQHPKLLGYHDQADKKALATFQGPAQAWHVTGTRGYSGALSRDVSDHPCDTESCTYGTGPEGRGDSRLSNGLTNEFMFALVVVKADAADGQPIGAVADMIAALALSHTGRRTGCSPLPSVLDALDPACAAETPIETLTAYDEAFLKGLYATDPENLGDVQRNSIAREIHRATRAPASIAK